MQNQRKSKSFTLIEILVSLIVIGIVATTFPIILQNIIQTSKNVSKEEVFYQEFSLLQLINTMYFDENNTVGDNYYKDLNATYGDSELFIKEDSTKGKYVGKYNRIGKFDINNNILRSGTNSTVSNIGPDSGEDDSSKYDDIDDFNGYEESVNFASGSVTLHVDVKYINDNADYSNNDINFTLSFDKKNLTNIKLISIYAKVGDNNITLYYPAMNIGASKFLSLEEIQR